MDYEHTQRAPLHWLLTLPALAMLSMGWFVRDQPQLLWLQLAVAATLFLLSLMFRRLTVRDEGQQLSVRFGPLPGFGTRVAYDEIQSVQPARSSWLDGWGVHWIPGRGTTYNLWGFDCVELKVRGRTLRIGSDDVSQLVAFLESKTHLNDAVESR
jgi:hypothetical protein